MTKEVLGRSLSDGTTIRVGIDGDRIAYVDHQEAALETPWIAPGLVDLQVNGLGADDFNGPIDAATPERVSRWLLRDGVTTYFPTIISQSPEYTALAIETISRACAAGGVARETIGGIHLEGPFISPEDGPRGAHDRRWVRAPDWSLMREWLEIAQGLIRLVTMSPEWPGSAAFIEQCVEAGLIVAIGHTAASPRQIRAAVAAGATMSTHLGNGSHAELPRHDNYLWEQLASDDLWASLIADGVHLPPSVLRTLLRAKADKAFLVSDSVASGLSGAGPTRAAVGGSVLHGSDRSIRVARDPRFFAGSDCVLREAVSYLATRGITDLATAWEMASTRPAIVAGLPQGQGLRPGAPADIVTFEIQSARVVPTAVVKLGLEIDLGAVA